MSVLGNILSSIVNATVTTGASAERQPGQMATMSEVDVDHVLEQLAEQSDEHLDWQCSIVDLLKLLGLDSSQQARQQLAHELGYPGDTRDSVAMNDWLHHVVIEHLEKNGGKVSDQLKSPKWSDESGDS